MTCTARSRIAAFALCLALTPAGGPRAAEDDPATPRPRTALRAALQAATQGVSDLREGSDTWMYGLTVSRDLRPYLSVEGTGGLASSHGLGLHLGAAVRIGLPGDVLRLGAFTLALGADAVVLRRFGTVSSAHVEAAFEFRKAAGGSIVIGAGPNVTLTTSRYRAAQSGWNGDGYRSGNVGIWFHAAAGLAF